MSFFTRAKERFLSDTEKERADVKESVGKLKEKVREYKEQRAYNNSEAGLKERLAAAKAEQSTQELRAEVKALERKNSFIGRTQAAIGNLKKNAQLKEQKVKGKGSPIRTNQNATRNVTLGAGRNIIYDQDPKGSRALILSDEKSKGGVLSGTLGGTGGIFADKKRKR